MAYHGATYAKVLRWLSFFEGRKDLELRWGLSFDEFLQSFNLPHKGRITEETILDIERTIHQEKIGLILSLMRYESKRTQRVLQVYLRRYEIKNLVNLVLSLLYHRPVAFLYELGKGYRIQPPFITEIKELKDLQSFLIH
ncbi:MAG: hypothetical protein ACK4HQ_04985, partial [Brevinematales bacterium]